MPSPAASSPEPLTVRVIDASAVPFGGPARLALRNFPQAPAIADRLCHGEVAAGSAGAAPGGAGRLTVTAPVDELIATIRREAGGGAEAAARAVEQAIGAWLQGPCDVDLGPGWDPLPTASRTVIQAVLNVTPDSFSDGGTFLPADGDLAPAIEAGRRMAAEGADIIDVGGESTRPGADPVPVELELARTVPVVRALADGGALVSIDTTKAVVARAAVEAGAAIVNDVSAGAMDAQLLPTVAELGATYVLMHMRGTPRTMQESPRYDDVVAEVFDHLAAGLAKLAALGVPASRVIIDPGIGFAKTMAHNLMLLRRLRELTSLGRPVLVGASRKSFIGHLTGAADPGDRLEGSLAAATLAVAGGARIVRVHDVVETARAVAVADAVRAQEEVAGG